MVFESIVVELVNRYLGTFVENLDTSQLKIGLWGGDVVLNNLNLKESALDDLDLPVKVKAGHIGKLTLKIPWKNLYSEAVVAQIDGIYALAVPNIAISYNEEKDEKAAQDAKQAKLAQIEEAKKLEAEKDKPRDPKQDSFVEKLATQVIKNLQIKVSSIHVRYEDKYTNPKRPFAIGVTLQELLFQTTDSNWKETIIKEAVTQIYKLVRLDSLSVYWNSKADLYQDKDRKFILNEMKDSIQKAESELTENIPKQGHKPNLQYLFKPISAVAHLRLNTKPELTDFSIPKIFLTLVFDEIAVSLSKDQYDDVLEMLESVERMSLLAMYKKTRPDAPYKDNYKKWWKHAYAAILEHTVQRRRQMWNWDNIKRHRDLVRQYREAYTQKLDHKKLSSKQQEIITNAEKELDIFNITMARNTAEVDAAKLGKKRQDEKNQSSGWFGGFFGGKKKKEEKAREGKSAVQDIGNKFQEEFTADEKAKLYKAIGYDENAKDPTFPVEYVAVRLVTKLNKLSVTILDSRKKDASLLKLILTEICASFGQRPAANAIRLDAKVDKMRVTGSPRKDYLPKMVNSIGVSKEENTSLLTVTFETNPQDGLCDTRIKVHSRPLEIIYDAITVNGMATFFKPPESVRLKQLSNAAMAKYDMIKAQTTAGVMYAMNERKYADIEVRLMPSYIIVPETGELNRDVNLLLLNLGALNISSEKTKELQPGVQMPQEELARYAYDKFNISLENVQLLFVQPGDSWQDENRSINSPLYILRPLSISLLLEKCVFANDPNFPQIRVSGELPLVSVTMSDNKLLGVMRLAESIPLPESPPEAKLEEITEEQLYSSDPRIGADTSTTMRAGVQASQTSEYTNLTQVALSFLVREITVEILETKEKEESPFLKLKVTHIGVNLKLRTFDMAVDAYLGGIFLQHMQYKVAEGVREQLKKCQVITGELINIINSPAQDDEEHLVSVSFLQADKKGPEFKTTYNNTEQSISVQFSALDLVLHQGVIISLLEFAKKIAPPEAAGQPVKAEPPKPKKTGSTASLNLKKEKDGSTTSTIKSQKQADILLMKLKALVDSIQLSICNENCVIMHSKVEGIEVGVGMHKNKMGVSALLRRIELQDPDPKTQHPKILSVSGSEIIKFEMTQFNNGTEGKRFDDTGNVDMDISLQMGRAKIVFVNKFVMSIVNFMDNFAVAKAKLDEAGKAMREASRDAAKTFQEKAPRIRLDVQVKAPLVVAPQNSRSLQVLMVHLGDICVNNKFEHISESGKRQPGQAYIAEKMVVTLTNLRLSRGILEKTNGSIKSEITILEPMSFKVDIRRNLSTGWYHGIPDIEVKGVLEKIDIKINQEDVRVALQLTQENLEERNPDGPKPTKTKVIVEATSDVTQAGSAASLYGDKGQKKLTGGSEEVYSTLKLDFTLVSVNVELFRGMVDMEAKQPTRNREKLLSHLCIKMLGVNLNMKSDTSMAAKVFLNDFTMDDLRSEKNGGITKLIRRTAFKDFTLQDLEKRKTEDENDMVLNLNFDQNSTQDKVVMIHMCSLHICVCVEFLMRVSDFFTKAFPPKEPKSLDQATLINTEQDMRASIRTSANSDAKEDEAGSLDLTLKLEKPEIYLIEDQMNQHTDSLIVDVEVNLRLRMNPDAMSINGAVKDLSLVSCVFAKEDTRQNKLYPKPRKISKLEKHLLEMCYNYYQHIWEKLPVLEYVLSPVDITVIGNGPQGKDHHIDITMTDFIMAISPATIRLLTAIAAGLSATPEEEGLPVDLKDYSSIWDKKSLEECNFWFTNSVVDAGSSVDEGEEAENALALQPSPSRGELRNEKLMLSAPVVVIKLEGGVGHRTVPLLIVESSFSGQVQNWSSDLFIESSMSLEVAYNNEKVGVWEPIIEPVMDTIKSQPHKWELSMEVIKTDEVSLRDEDDQSILPPPKMTVNVVATEPLQVLMTKTCLDVLNNLGQAFNEAYQLREMEGTLGQKIIPYLFKNQTGKVLSLKVDSSFQVAPESSDINLEKVPTGTDIFMDIKTKKALTSQTSLIRSTQKQDEKRISFEMAESKRKIEVTIKQARKRMFELKNYSVVVNVEAHIGQKIVSFVSFLQVENHLPIAVEVLYHHQNGVSSCGVAYPEQCFSVPLEAVYSSTGEIFFQPKGGDGYEVSKECMKWKGLPDVAKIKQISCEPSKKGKSSYYFNVLPEQEKIFHENTEDKTDQMITFHLHPTVILHNLLPFDVQYVLETQSDQETQVMNSLKAGQNIPLPHASINHTTVELQIPKYRGFKWKGKKLIKMDVPELSVWSFEADDNGKAIYMDLGLHCKENQGSFDISVYCPYWIVNLTEQQLALKEDDKEAPLIHEKDDKGIMLFYFRDKPLFGSSTKKKKKMATMEASGDKKKPEKTKELKKPGKVMLRIAEAEWSDKFSLDTVGSSGNVSCKNKAAGNQLEVGVNITLTSSGLTKIVTFTPFYLLLNASIVPICIQEAEEKDWSCVQPGECKPYYPKAAAKDMKIQAKVQDSGATSNMFFLNKAHTTLLKLDDKYGGINAECQVSESAMVTTFNIYQPGMATVQFVNHTSQCTVSIKQVGSTTQVLNLEPQSSQLYTWDDPTGKREISWSCGNKKDMKSALDRDNIEEFFAQSDIKVYFVSFLDGMQRVVMFTQDLALATVAQEAGELEQADQEVNLKIHDMGFSLINNEKFVELAYMGITSSGIIWEEKKKRYKAMKLKDMAILEHAYQKYQMEVSAGKNKSPVVMLENKLEVDFEKMTMLKPRQCAIRRSFEDGIWAQMRKSPHSMQFHAKLNRLQFDNQLRQAIFPTVLSPLPPPKSVAADSVPKPFVEVSLMTRLHEHSSLVQIKYFKVLIQEMNLKVDQGFLNEIIAMFASDVKTLREQESGEFKKDIDSTKRSLKEEAGVSMHATRVSFYDYFHVSPIKVHVSFSLQGGSMSDTPQANIMGVFLQSVGVVLTDVQDVVFKLGYFERNHSFYNNTQLTNEFIRHYSGQAVKQMYVLVLGLDVLGNPFGLLRGLSEGIEDLFYEPYQGAIQGPEEFAEGLALGVRSLFGHAVGGAAGAVSRITGTLGKGLAALTLDDDYQKKRREQLNKRPATAREGFARGGKGLVMGVFDGVTGIVRKPVEGAKQEGVAGFFKGMGKGLVGVVTRPTSGVVDFASSSLEGIRRITDFSDEIHRLRPPRRFNKDGIIRPYIREEAEGYNLLLETDKGRYVESDEYVTHCKIREDGKLVFIVTDKRVMMAKRGEIFGSWDTDWVFTYQEMKEAPKQTSKGIEILLKEREKKKLFSSNVTKKDVPISDPAIASAVLKRIVETMESDGIESGV